jgi:hypothetical protein
MNNYGLYLLAIAYKWLSPIFLGFGKEKAREAKIKKSRENYK